MVEDAQKYFQFTFALSMFNPPSIKQFCDLRSLQSVVGEPMYPSGQVHLGVWLMTLQMAEGAQGLSTAHGFMH